MSKFLSFSFLLPVLLVPFLTSAQDKLILTSGDTLTGTLDILLAGNNFEEVIMDTGKQKDRYKSHEFISFTKGDQEYRTVKYGEKYRIMEVEVDGYLSLLRFRSGDNYMFNAQYLQKRGGDGLEVPSISFKKNLTEFTQDCPSVSDKVESGELKRRDIEDIVRQYNQCMIRKTEARYSGNVTSEPTPPEKSGTLVNEVVSLANRARELDDQDLATMLTDVANKLKAGDSIPGYLKSALTEHVNDGHELKDQVNSLINNL